MTFTDNCPGTLQHIESPREAPTTVHQNIDAVPRLLRRYFNRNAGNFLGTTRTRQPGLLGACGAVREPESGEFCLRSLETRDRTHRGRDGFFSWVQDREDRLGRGPVAPPMITHAVRRSARLAEDPGIKTSESVRKGNRLHSSAGNALSVLASPQTANVALGPGATPSG